MNKSGPKSGPKIMDFRCFGVVVPERTTSNTTNNNKIINVEMVLKTLCHRIPFRDITTNN